MPGGYVCSASMKARLRGMTDVKRCVAGERRIRKLFSKQQRAFFTAHAPEGIKLDDLTLLGPVFVLKITSRHRSWDASWGRDVAVPDGSRILELSTKCAPAQMFQVVAEGRGFLPGEASNSPGAADEDRNGAELLRHTSPGTELMTPPAAALAVEACAGFPADRSMGSEEFYPEEAPVRRVRSRASGSTSTGHRRGVPALRARDRLRDGRRAPLDPAEYPDADPALLVPGSLVFQPDARTGRPARLPQLVVVRARRVLAAARGPGERRLHGRAPSGHAGRLRGRRGLRRLGGQGAADGGEWECAARGGLDGAAFAWGDEDGARRAMMANTWQGEFPWQNLLLDGYEGTSPVGRSRPTARALRHDRQRWEWTCDAFAIGRTPRARAAAAEPRRADPRRVIKGGSHLCAPNYCLRYRPAARQSEDVDSSTSHIGFRCVARVAACSLAGGGV